jgi:hypothetical protein
MKLPDFMIVGAARCGTTSLFYYLKDHPNIGFPEMKEPKYFSSLHMHFPHHGPGDETVDRKVIGAFNDYTKLFKGLESYYRVGEASSDYLYYAEFTAPAIREALGDISIVMLLRNPVERAYSAYLNMVRDSRESLSFRAALNAEESRLKENWDWMWAYRAGGLYSRNVAIFMNTFSKVKVLLYDDLTTNPDELLREVCTFLSVDPDYSFDTRIKYSQSGRPMGILKHLISRSNNFSASIRSLVMRIFPRPFLEQYTSQLLTKSDMTPEDRRDLTDFYRADLSILEALLARNLSSWK